VEDDEKTMGGTFIPDTGKIVPLNVKVGDRVLFVKWSGGEPKVRLARYPDQSLAVFHGPRCLARYDKEGALLKDQAKQKVA
jgi:co-chaperonin GroES (HSP10)